MFKNSTELLEYAQQEIERALTQKNSTVKIFLDPCFSGNTEKMKEFCDKWEISTITEILRKQYKELIEIKSVVGGSHLKEIITYSKGPCDRFYPLIWDLTLIKK